VFDKVEENNDLVRAEGNLTYSGMVNLSLNQTLMRTLNTTITSSLPVASLLIIGGWLMGAATLRDFSLALLVGLVAGAYSSFFVACPLLALLREREPAFRALRSKVMSAGQSPTEVPDRIKAVAGGGRASAAKRANVRSSSGSSGERETTTTATGRVIPARPRKKGNRPKAQAKTRTDRQRDGEAKTTPSD
jgi:preprotein translocase subunit SecF